jgi:hypothetical protein
VASENPFNIIFTNVLHEEVVHTIVPVESSHPVKVDIIVGLPRSYSQIELTTLGFRESFAIDDVALTSTPVEQVSPKGAV